MAIAVTHTTPADGTFSAPGAAAWDASHTLSGFGTGVATALGINVGTAGSIVVNGGDFGTPSAGVLTNATGLPITTGLSGGSANGIPYFTSATAQSVLAATNNAIPFFGVAGVPTKSTDLIYVDSTKLLTVGSGSGTSAGLAWGYGQTSTQAAIYYTGDLPGSASNYRFAATTSNTAINAPSTVFILAGSTVKITQNNIAGAGPLITAGTATTAVSPLSTTQAFNAVGVSFPGVVHAFTGAATAAAGTKLLDITLDGVRNFSVNKTPSINVGFGTLADQGSGQLAINSAYYFASAGFQILDTLPIKFTNGFGGSATSGISSNGASTIAIGNGTAGNASGTLQVLGITRQSTGGAATIGNATLVGGTVTVNTTSALAGSFIPLNRKTSGGTIGTSFTYTISAGTSFTITSDNPLDTSVVTWQIFN